MHVLTHTLPYTYVKMRCSHQLMCLRETNYNVLDAIAFAEINYGHKQATADGTSSASAMRERTLDHSLSNSGLEKATGVSVEGETATALGNLSQEASAYIFRLEKEVADLKSKLADAESRSKVRLTVFVAR